MFKSFVPSILIWNCALLLIASGNPSQRFGPVDGADLPPTDLERVQVGQPAPDFRLPDHKGQTHTLSDYRGQKVVLVFYRGYW